MVAMKEQYEDLEFEVIKFDDEEDVIMRRLPQDGLGSDEMLMGQNDPVIL
jgi:hypothetical protein